MAKPAGKNNYEEARTGERGSVAGKPEKACRTADSIEGWQTMTGR